MCLAGKLAQLLEVVGGSAGMVRQMEPCCKHKADEMDDIKISKHPKLWF